MKRFKSYTREELKAVIKEFVHICEHNKDHLWVLDRRTAKRWLKSTELWTDFVLDYFAATAAEGMVVDARRANSARGWSRFLKQQNTTTALTKTPVRETSGEFMLDLVHSGYPGYQDGYMTAKYWNRALLKGKLKLRFAMESEFGKEAEKKRTRFEVLHDAAKLAAVRAPLKLMLFGTTEGGEETEAVKKDLRELRAGNDDDATWGWIDLPWNVNAKGDWLPSGGLL